MPTQARVFLLTSFRRRENIRSIIVKAPIFEDLFVSLFSIDPGASSISNF